MFLAPLVALALIAAQDWPDAGDWIIDRDDERCMTGLEYEGTGSTKLTVSLEMDGSSIVLVDNTEWSAVNERDYPDMAITIGSVTFSGAGATGYTTVGSRTGFSMNMPDGFVDSFASGSSLRIHNGEQLVDQLSLDGSGAAASGLKRCTAAVKREFDAKERERARLAHIPADPFSTSTESMDPSEPSWSLRPRPTADDMPARALERGVSGMATVRCNILQSGGPTGCLVVSETPAGQGFGRAAIRIVQRGRVAISQSSDTSFTTTINFNIDEPPTVVDPDAVSDPA